MSYIVMDLQGNRRELFESRDELIAELEEVEREDPAVLTSWYVITLDEAGSEIGESQRADEFVMAARPQAWSFVLDFAAASVSPFGAAPESDERYRQVAALATAGTAR